MDKLKGLKEKLDQLGFSPNYFNSLKVNFDKKEREMAESNLKKLNSKKKCMNQIMSTTDPPADQQRQQFKIKYVFAPKNNLLAPKLSAPNNFILAPINNVSAPIF